MTQFLSCDWGTSSFRLRLVNAADRKVLWEKKGQQGIANTFAAWKQSNLPETERQAFYERVFNEQVEMMATEFGQPLQNTPRVFSGMASSSIGMFTLPYKPLPFATDGSDLIVEVVPSALGSHAKMAIVSGARTAKEVLRGEETMLIGCKVEASAKKHLFIFPGTHSKHIIVKNKLVVSFSTFMTGEFFDLLSGKSILSASVEKSDDPGENGAINDFAAGVQAGANSNLLNSVFRVRTRHLFNEATSKNNYEYLSGLLIGYELGSISGSNVITIVASETLQQKYLNALSVLKLYGKTNAVNADEALVNGHCKIFESLKW